MNERNQLVTLGEISREMGERENRIKYAVSSYQIEPVQRAGIIRLFSREQIPQIKSALQRIATRREVQHA